MGIKVSFAKLSNSLKMKPVPELRLVSKLEFLSARQLLFLEKLRRAKLFWMELIVLSANCKGTSQIPVLQSTMQTINGSDMTSKRQLESSIHTMQAEVDGMLLAAKNAEEKSKKAMVDAARLADELRAEQDHATS